MPSGALAKDRRWAMIVGQGNFVNAKRTPRIHELSAHLILAHDQATMAFAVSPSRQLLVDSPSPRTEPMAQRLFRHLKIRLIENSEVGHPDDLVAPGPSILSTASLQGIASWFDGQSSRLATLSSEHRNLGTERVLGRPLVRAV